VGLDHHDRLRHQERRLPLARRLQDRKYLSPLFNFFYLIIIIINQFFKKKGSAAPQPYKFFDRHPDMRGMQMINYRTTSVPDPSNPSRTMPVGCLVGIAKVDERIGKLKYLIS
jgi:hypothetical protein